MKKNQIVRAWRNADEYHDLSAAEKGALPESPAATLDVDDDALASLTGGCAFSLKESFCTPCPGRHCAA